MDAVGLGQISDFDGGHCFLWRYGNGGWRFIQLAQADSVPLSRLCTSAA